MSANHRYAPTLATEASLSSSEPESAAESPAGSAARSAAGLAWGESGEEKAVPCVAGSSSGTRGFGAVPGHAEGTDATCQPKVTARLAAGKAHAVWKKAGLQRRQADSASITAHDHHGAKLQRHLHAEQSSKPPSTPAAPESMHASAHPSRQHAVLPLGQEEESGLLASVQRLDCQLSTAHKGSSHGEAPQHARRSSSSRVPSPAQHSRLLPSEPFQQKPLQSQCAAHADEASPPPSTQAIPTGPGAKVARSRLSGRAPTWSTAPADLPTIPLNSATAGSTVSGGQAKRRGGRKAAAAKLQGGARAGAGMLSKAAAAGSSEADVTNSAEQQALQQSLAKLDARLTSLTARCAGRSMAPL